MSETENYVLGVRREDGLVELTEEQVRERRQWRVEHGLSVDAEDAAIEAMQRWRDEHGAAEEMRPRLLLCDLVH